MKVSSRHKLHLVVTLVTAGFALLAFAPAAKADGGVAVDLSEIAVEDHLDPGRRYELPRITVRNPGDEPSSYRMSAGGVGDDGLLDPVDEWFSFEPNIFELDAHATQAVVISLRLPEDVPPGDYSGLLRAELLPEGEGSLVGVAAGARISFVVTEPGDLGAFLRWLVSIFTALMPWSYIVPLVLLAVLVSALVQRRFRIRIEAR
jgi:hypothetical protein